MKKLIIIALLLAFTHQYLFGQYNWQKIYNSDYYGIRQFNGEKVNVSNRKLIYIQHGLNFNPFGNPNESGRYLRLNKNNFTWVVPSNGFLNALWCLGSIPPNPPTYHCNPVDLFKVSAIDTQFIIANRDVYCGGYDGGDITYLTYNSGINSVQISLLSNSFLGQQCRGFDIDPVNDAIVYAGYWSSSFIYKSTNRGANWFITDTVPLSPIPLGFVKINPLKRSNIFAAGSTMYLSTSSGYNFFPINVGPFKKMAFDLVDSSVYGITSTAIFKSTNLGLNWLQLQTFGGNLSAIEISPDNHSILYTGSDSGLYRSNNGGFTWNIYNNSFSPSKKVIGISKDPGTGESLYVCTPDAVYKVWGAYVGVYSIYGYIPEKYSLHQNYPNPFNPVTKIRFEIAELRFVRLIIYDVLGREVATLVKVQLKPGTYEVEWDGTNYNSGIYLYKLISNEYAETKKMILIK